MWIFMTRGLSHFLQLVVHMSAKYAPVEESDSQSETDTTHGRVPSSVSLPSFLSPASGARALFRGNTNRYTRALDDDIDLDFEDPPTETPTTSHPHSRISILPSASHSSSSPRTTTSASRLAPHPILDRLTQLASSFASSPAVRWLVKHCSLWRVVGLIAIIVVSLAIYANLLTPMGTRMLSHYMPELRISSSNTAPPSSFSLTPTAGTTPATPAVPTYISTCLSGHLPTDLTMLSSLITISRLTGRSILLSDRPLGLPHARLLPAPMQARALLKGRAVRVDIKRKRMFTSPVGGTGTGVDTGAGLSPREREDGWDGSVKKSGDQGDEWQLLAWARANGWLSAVGLDRYFTVDVAGDAVPSTGAAVDTEGRTGDSKHEGSAESEGGSVWVRSTLALQTWLRAVTGVADADADDPHHEYGYGYGASGYGSLGIALDEILDVSDVLSALSAPLTDAEQRYLWAAGVPAPPGMQPRVPTAATGESATVPTNGEESTGSMASRNMPTDAMAVSPPKLLSVRTPPFSFFHKHCVRVDALYCLASDPPLPSDADILRGGSTLHSDATIYGESPFGSDRDTCRAAAPGCTDCVFAHVPGHAVTVPVAVVSELAAAAQYARGAREGGSGNGSGSSIPTAATAAAVPSGAKWGSFASSLVRRRDTAVSVPTSALALLLRAPHQHIHLSAALAAAITPAHVLANAPAAAWPGVPRERLILPPTVENAVAHTVAGVVGGTDTDITESSAVAAAAAAVAADKASSSATTTTTPTTTATPAVDAATTTAIVPNAGTNDAAGGVGGGAVEQPSRADVGASVSASTDAGENTGTDTGTGAPAPTPARATPRPTLHRYLPLWSPVVRLEALKVLSSLAAAVAPDEQGLHGRSSVLCGVVARRTVAEGEKGVVGVRSGTDGDVLSQVRVWVRDNSCGAVFFLTDAVQGEASLLDNAAKGVITMHGCRTPACQDSPTIAAAVGMAVLEGLHHVLAPLWQGDEAGLLVARARRLQGLPVTSFTAMGRWRYGEGKVDGCPIWEDC